MAAAFLGACLISGRIKNEEEVLKQELPDYEEYLEKVKYRLIPNI